MEEVVGQLKAINLKLDTIIDSLRKPRGKMARVFEVAATGVGILGILSIVDVVRNWLFGG